MAHEPRRISDALAARAERKIVVVRGHRVLLDSDLAALYEVPTRRLNEQVRRNLARFPTDFMFELTAEEVVDLRSQIAISSRGHGGRRHAPLAFTEQGVAMLSSVLRSPRAVAVNIAIIRRIDDIEKRYDGQFRVVFDAIRALIDPPSGKKARIGFRP